MKYEEITSPEELLKFMDNINYGYETLDGIRCIGEGEEFEKNILNWTLSSPERLLKNKLGHCYDQVELERDWFTSHNYEFKTYFMIFELPYENNKPTHTFLVYKENDRYYHFEHSDELNRGIHKYNTIEECLDSALEHQIDFAKKFAGLTEEESKTLAIYEYSKPSYDIGFDDFINNILDNGHRIK